MPSKCCVISCTKRAERDIGCKFFRFPALRMKPARFQALSQERRVAWLNALKRKELSLNDNSTKYMRICSEHFITGSPAALDDKLHPDWVPNKKLGYSAAKVSIKRFERAQKRLTAVEYKEVLNTLDTAIVETAQDAVDEPTNELDTLKAELKLKNEKLKKLEEDIKKYQFEQQEIIKDYEEKLKEKDNNLAKQTRQIEIKAMNSEGFKNDDKKVKYFTGLLNYVVLINVFEMVKNDLSSCLCKNINIFDAFILTLTKIRLDLTFTYLGYKYGVSLRTVSRLFHENIIILYSRLGIFVRWPDKIALNVNTPIFFQKALGSNFTVIIDCFEIFIEQPGNLLSRAEVFSSYKHHSTMKYLIGISPAGAIIYVSKGYGGRCSDKTIVENSGFLDNIEAGDIILSDRGMLINKVVLEKGAMVHMPAFRNRRDQLEVQEIERTRNLAKVRIHVERIIGVLRQKYLILSNRQPITATSKNNGYDMYFDYIVKTACALVNLCPGIIIEKN